MYGMMERMLPLANWGGGWGHGPGMMGWGMMGWIGPIMMLVFWAAVVVAVIFLVRWITASTSGRAEAEDTALDILKKRYARGEIDKEEFEAKKKDLV
jgi:putative membrane protein